MTVLRFLFVRSYQGHHGLSLVAGGLQEIRFADEFPFLVSWTYRFDLSWSIWKSFAHEMPVKHKRNVQGEVMRDTSHTVISDATPSACLW